MEQEKGTLCPFSAECDGRSCKKIADVPQKKEELDENRNEPLYKNQGSQTSISEKQMTADEKFSEEGVQDRLPSKGFPILPHKASSPSPSSFWNHLYYKVMSKWLMRSDSSLPSPFSLQLTKLISSAQLVRNNVSLQCQRSLKPPSGLSYKHFLNSPVCSRKTKGALWEKRDQVLSKTTVQCNPDIKHSVTSVPLSEHSYKRTYTPLWYNRSCRKLCTTMPQSMAIIPSVDSPPCPESSAEVPKGSSTEEELKQAFPNLCIFSCLSQSNPTQLQHLSGSTKFSAAFNWNNVSLPWKPSHQMSNPRYFGPGLSSARPSDVTYIQQSCFLKRSCVSEHGSTSFLYLPSFLNRSTCSQSITPSDAGRLYPPESPLVCQGTTNSTGESLKQGEWGFPVQSESDPGGDRSALEEVGPPVTAEHYSTEDSLPVVGSHLQQPSYSSRGRTEDCYDASHSIVPIVFGASCLQCKPGALQDSTVCTEGSGLQDGFELLSVQSEREAAGDHDALMEVESSVTAVNYSVTNTLPTKSHLQISSSDSGWSRRDSSCLSPSHSMSSLRQITSAKKKTFTRSQSLPDMLIRNSFEEFTPDITVDENEETYRFQCLCPGLYQCSVTGLVFHMEGGGDVVYRIVPWNRRLLARHHKQPAGPLFDIKCVQQSVCQLHLPHCEIRSTGGCGFLSVAHVKDEGVEFIAPHKITETHVVINITGFSGFGNVKDEDSPPVPVRALVLLFYRPPADPDIPSLLNVLLLPRNVVIQNVLRTRRKLVGDESYIETSPHCKLQPEQEYTLSTRPEDDSVLIQPTEAEFDFGNYDNYFPSFQVRLKTIITDFKLLLRDTNSSQSVWEREVCLSSTGVKRSCGQGKATDRLLDIRSGFIDGISGPVLKNLLDKLLEKKVMTDAERESADHIQNRSDKARFVIDTVRKKGEAAGSEMIEFLCEVDSFLCEHLGLI